MLTIKSFQTMVINTAKEKAPFSVSPIKLLEIFFQMTSWKSFQLTKIRQTTLKVKVGKSRKDKKSKFAKTV